MWVTLTCCDSVDSSPGWRCTRSSSYTASPHLYLGGPGHDRAGRTAFVRSHALPQLLPASHDPTHAPLVRHSTCTTFPSPTSTTRPFSSAPYAAYKSHEPRSPPLQLPAFISTFQTAHLLSSSAPTMHSSCTTSPAPACRVASFTELPMKKAAFLEPTPKNDRSPLR